MESIVTNAYTHRSTTTTELISTKPTLAEQLSKTLNSELHKNQTIYLLIQSHRLMLSPCKASYLLCKGMPKTPVSAKHKSTPITKFKYLMLFILNII
jgi:hypothetical protein